jgi:hypothetical protein
LSVKQVWRQNHDSTEIVLDAGRKCLKVRVKRMTRRALSGNRNVQMLTDPTRPHAPSLFHKRRSPRERGLSKKIKKSSQTLLRFFADPHRSRPPTRRAELVRQREGD